VSDTDYQKAAELLGLEVKRSGQITTRDYRGPRSVEEKNKDYPSIVGTKVYDGLGNLLGTRAFDGRYPMPKFHIDRRTYLMFDSESIPTRWRGR